MNTFENLGPVDFQKKMNDLDDVVILDVRTPEETAQGTIEGAKELNFFDPAFREQVEELDKSKNYLVYCRSGNRSGKTCQLMAESGFTGELVNLQGGYVAWEAQKN